MVFACNLTAKIKIQKGQTMLAGKPDFQVYAKMPVHALLNQKSELSFITTNPNTPRQHRQP